MIAQNSVFESKNLRKNLSMTNFTDLLFNHLTTPNHHDLLFFSCHSKQTSRKPVKFCWLKTWVVDPAFAGIPLRMALSEESERWRHFFQNLSGRTQFHADMQRYPGNSCCCLLKQKMASTLLPISSSKIDSIGNIWMFLKGGVPPNHPF